MSSLQILINRLPKYSQNLGIELKNLSVCHCNLTPEQFSGAILSIAYAIENERLLNYIKAYSKTIIDDDLVLECKKAVVIIKSLSLYTFNVKILDKSNKNKIFLVNDKKESKTKEFILFCYAASLIFKVNVLTSEYEQKIISLGFNETQLEMIYRLASVLDGIALSLFIESMGTYEFSGELTCS
ncbi:hypothetical protein [Lyticum sinuosum]|uniref:Alkyl hydroperoxide reductase n=1 Tax=Lyticum sinuosum TaxID=1332059 RepID=A0AAE5AHC6_9RICK|nr:hypothetical protein [Lyticum sinuosum]MDZ5760953.1 putative alkyl hydroperoxide reductase [Lyticum sinuosum]